MSKGCSIGYYTHSFRHVYIPPPQVLFYLLFVSLSNHIEISTVLGTNCVFYSKEKASSPSGFHNNHCWLFLQDSLY